jgi:hypothetical protein
MVEQPAATPESWSFDLPDKLKFAIADALTVFARIDNCMIETLWAIEGAGLARKKQIAKAFAHGNSEAIKAFITEIPGAETNKIWPTLADLRQERNLIAHGVWMVSNDDRPMVLWHSKFLESDDFVGAEYFDYARFSYFMKRAIHLLDVFMEFQRIIEELAEKQKADQGAGGQS